MDKEQTRKRLKQILTQIEPQQRSIKSKRICEQVIDSEEFKKASVIMAYLSMQYEADTTPIILQAWQQGKTVAVPKVFWEQRHMIAVEINSLETGLATEQMGLKNPVNETPVPYGDIDLVLTPGLGFDKKGNRLGRGGAYYDRFLRAEGLRAGKWALAFSEQILEKIPYDDEDVPMDIIVTDKEIIHCRP